MKPKRRILSLLLAICLVVGIMPTAAFAANNDKAIQLGASNISGYDSTNGYDYIYYGEWDNSPIKWRVLDEQTNTQNEGLFLLSDVLLGTGTDGGVYFDNSGSDSNVWQNSTAQTWCKNFYSNNFSSKEQNAVLATTKSDSAYTSTSFGYAYGVSSLSGDKVFFLSAEEAENSAYGFTDDNARIANYGNSAGYWWLRSPYANYSDFAGLVYYSGYVDSRTVSDDRAARPAFNLNLNSVLFTSAAEGGKSTAAASGGNQGAVGADAIFEIGAYTGNEWKLTLLDNSRNFAVTEDNASGNPGETITLNYTGATTGTNEYISAIIADKSGAQYYGRVAQPTEASGQIQIKIPASLADGTYTLHVFSEQYNGDYKTDYASEFATVNLTVEDTIAPALSGGSATRTSETAATVKFTSDEAGTCYYIAQDTEITLTKEQIAAQGTQQACEVGENEIKLDNISASAQYVAVVAQDAAENISDILNITIPAYVAPVYDISADPQSLDFGTVTEGYTEAPAAKTVTITNTGNQTVTVDLPTSTDYIITAGEGFTNDTATLAPNGTASFTVQPNTGLAVGDCSETLTISGSDGADEKISLSFEVLATYTLTVNLNGGSGSTAGGEYPAGKAIHIDAGSRSNYRFNGWTSSNGGTFTDASSASTTFTMPAADTTITAAWSYNGGSSSGGSTTTPTISQQIITRIKAAKDGDTVEATLKPSQTKLDKEVFETLSGRDVTLVLHLDGEVDWTIYGQDIAADAVLTDLDMGVSMNTTTIPVDLINAITGEIGTVQISLAHDGEFGFVLTLTAPLGAEYQNLWANLYRYDESAGAMTFQTAALVDEDGNVALRFTHASEYAIVLDDKSHELPFTDLTAGAWYWDAVAYVYRHDIMAGYGDNLFGPNDDLSRAQLCQIVYNMEGQPTASGGGTFNDVADGAWYFDAVTWAASQGIVGGYGNGKFGPDDAITREQLATILYRYAQAKGYDVSVGEDTNILSYTDAQAVSEYAIPAMQWACGAGIIQGNGGYLNPQGDATRAEIATMLMRFCGYYANTK